MQIPIMQAGRNRHKTEERATIGEKDGSGKGTTARGGKGEGGDLERGRKRTSEMQMRV